MRKEQLRWFRDQRYPDQLICEEQIKQEYGSHIVDGSIDLRKKVFSNTCCPAWKTEAVR